MKRVKKWLPRLLPWIITLLLLRFLIGQGADWQQLTAEWSRANLALLAMALCFQAGAYGAVAWLNALLLRSYHINVPWFRQYTIQFAMAFMETVVPSAALSGLLLRARLLKPYGASSDVATVTTLVETFTISLTVLVPALIVGAFMAVDGMQSSQAAFFLLLLLLAMLLVLSGLRRWQPWWRPAGRSVWAWAVRLWDVYLVQRFPGRLGEYPSHRLGRRFRYLAGELQPLLTRRPHWLLSALTLRTACEVVAFAFCFFAFGEVLSILTVLLLYTITITVNTFGAVPGGVGLAEVSLAAIYTQFGVSPEGALAVALAYRITGYWLPRVAGGFSWLWLERRHRVEAIA